MSLSERVESSSALTVIFALLPDLKLDALSVQFYGLDFEIDACRSARVAFFRVFYLAISPTDRRYERRVERVVGEAKENARLANAAVSNQQKLEEHVEVLLSHVVASDVTYGIRTGVSTPLRGARRKNQTCFK